ncbi:multicopper oxidase domain-containing protein [Micromonospora sp. M12]
MIATGALAAGTLGAAAPAIGTVFGGSPPGCRRCHQKITIYAEQLPGNLFGYGLAPGQATVPGPILEIYEGDTLEITLVNTTTQRLSIHPHGVDYSTDSDGSPFNASFNNPGETRTYVWRSHEMVAAAGRRYMPGSAGYWHYHDHAMGTDHGTGGVAKGLYGALIVRRRGDVLPSKQFTAVFHDMMINNRMAPATPMFEANLGERVEWIAIGHGNLFHTFHLHAHRWADNRTGMLEGPSDPSLVIDNKDLNPGSSFGFQVLAGRASDPARGCTTATCRRTPTAAWPGSSWCATPTAACRRAPRRRSTGSRATPTRTEADRTESGDGHDPTSSTNPRRGSGLAH